MITRPIPGGRRAFAERQRELSQRVNRASRRKRDPVHATDQRMGVLEISKSAGTRGVHRERFLIPANFGGFGVSQVATRINELRRQGCVIDSRRVHPEDKFVTYFLRFAPERLKELAQDSNLSTDWYEQKTGRKRPGPDFGPLFSGVEQ